jgi:uncharacterized membrane protein YkvA (DUF1232 family)
MFKTLTRTLLKFKLADMKLRVVALWLLWRDPRTPRAARWLALLVLAYALSPIDLIPDFIPVLGLLDDIILVPLGLAWVVKLTPPALWQECLAQAPQVAQRLPRWMGGAVLVVLVWLLFLGLGLAGVVAWLASTP